MSQKWSVKYWTGNVPPEVLEALEEYIEEHELEYADNYRFSPVDDDEDMTEYKEIERRGCCGQADFETVDASGRIWMVGCNYGH